MRRVKALSDPADLITASGSLCDTLRVPIRYRIAIECDSGRLLGEEVALCEAHGDETTG